MFFKNYQLMFLFFVVAGTMIAVSSNSWVTCWAGLEINLMSFIPIILSETNFKSTEISIKYFLTQAIASVILIVSASFLTSTMEIYYLDSMNFLLFMSLSIKAGLAPFHVWFPQVTEFISWFKCLLIFSWQKIAPFLLMSNFNMSFILFTMVGLSATVGALGGLNQMNNKILLTYSSIAHSAWMLMLVSSSSTYWTAYFLIYFLTLTPIIYSFYIFNIKKIKEISSSKLNLKFKLILSTLIMTLGGLPPFLGFLAKISALLISIKIFPTFIILILITSSLVSLYFYSKMFFNMLTSSSPEKKIYFFLNNNINKFIFVALSGNLILSMVVLLI